MNETAKYKIKETLEDVLDMNNYTGIYTDLGFELIEDELFDNCVDYLVTLEFCNVTKITLEMGYDIAENEVYLVNGEDIRVKGTEIEKQIIVDIIYELVKKEIK